MLQKNYFVFIYSLKQDVYKCIFIEIFQSLVCKFIQIYRVKVVCKESSDPGFLRKLKSEMFALTNFCVLQMIFLFWQMAFVCCLCFQDRAFALEE